MSEKPEALRLAEECEAEIVRTVSLDVMHQATANELRRLHAEVEALRVALGEIAWSNDSKWQSDRADAALNPPAAIDAAMEQTK